MKIKNTYKIPLICFRAARLMLITAISIFFSAQASTRPVESSGTCTFSGCDDCFLFQVLGPLKEVHISKNPDARLITPCRGDNLDGFFEFFDQSGVVNIQSGVGRYQETGTFTGNIGDEINVVLPAKCTGDIDDNAGTFSLHCVIKESTGSLLGILDIPVLSVPSDVEYILRLISN